MTLLDIRNQIISIFCQKDVFVESDFASINVPTEHEAEKASFVLATLDELEENGLVRRASPTTWILTTPLNVQGQEVHISMNTGNAIAATVNTYLDANGHKGPRVDVLNISEGAIFALVQIIDDLLESGPV